MVLPVVEVSHLPSSSSYFAAILQPLGLVYISSEDTSRPTHRSVVFGTPKRPVLEIRQVLSLDDVHGPVHIVFTAPTRSAVANFHQRGIRANPSQSVLLQVSTNCDTLPNTGGIRATVIDMDGNRIEAVYPGHHLLDAMTKQNTRPSGQTWAGLVDRGLEHGQGSSTPVVNTRVFPPLEPPERQPGEASRRAAEEFASTLSGKSILKSKSMPSTNTQAGKTQGGSGTISTSTVVGTLLGLAAGAIFTYGIVSSNNEASHDQADSSPASSRNVKSEPRLPGGGGKGEREPGSSSGDMPVKATSFQYGLPHRHPWDRQLGGHEAGIMRKPPPIQPSHAGQVKPQACRDITSTSNPVEPEEKGVGRPHVVPGSSLDGGLKDVWVGNAAPAPIVNYGSAGLSLAKHNRRSLAATSFSSRRSSNMPRQVVPSRARTATLDAERESFVSARSRVSSSPANPQWMPPPMSHVSASRIPLPETVVFSVSAKDVHLPASGVGSSCIDLDDDNDSIAPSDSISCVGSGRRHGA